MLILGGKRASPIIISPGFSCPIGTTPIDDKWKNPFNETCASRIPIGTGAVYAGDSDQTTLDLKMHGYNGVNISWSGFWGHREAYGRESDPVRTVVVTDTGGNATIHIPNSFVANTNDQDSACTIYDETDGPNGTFHQFFGYHGNWSNGTPYKAQIHKIISPIGNAYNCSTSASKFHQLAVNIRTHEWDNPDPVTHALNLNLMGKKQSDRLWGPTSRCQYASTYRWPAAGVDRFAIDGRYPGVTPGSIQYGTRWGILPFEKGGPNPASLSLGAVGSIRWKMYYVLRNYGAISIDATDSPAARGDQNLGTSLANSIKAAYSDFFKYLREIKNTSSTQLIAQGGGEPLAANCAYNSGAPRV